MEKSSLGGSALRITPLCLGSWNMEPKDGWGPENDRAALDLIRYAVETGCNFIDTAMGYGRGHSEELIAEALGAKRSDVVLATKTLQCPPAKARANLEGSLRRLGTDYVDLYICHWPVPRLPLTPFFEELCKLKDEGKIREIGVSNFNVEQMETAIRFGAICLQPPFSILWQMPDDLLAFCRERNVAITPYSPLAQGILAGRFTRQDTPIAGTRAMNQLLSDTLRPHSLKVAREVDQIADAIGCPSSCVALAWLLQTPGVASVITGVSRRAQWDENLRATEIRLSQSDYERLDNLGRAVRGRLSSDDTMWGWKPS